MPLSIFSRSPKVLRDALVTPGGESERKVTRRNVRATTTRIITVEEIALVHFVFYVADMGFFFFRSTAVDSVSPRSIFKQMG